MKKITLGTLLLFCFSAFSQITLISPAGDGGFETGTTFTANGWTAVNPGGNNRIWYVGTGQAGYTGTRAAFIGNSATSVGMATANRTVHFYRSITIPSGAENITLSFKYKQAVADFVAGDYYDYIAVYTGNAVPTNGALPTGTLQFGPFPNANLTTFTTQTVVLPNNLAGTTTNLIFTFVADNVAEHGYGAVDDISLTYELPACQTPSNLDYTGLSASGINLTWNASATATSGYDYYFSTDATAPTSATTPSGSVATGTTATISTLSPQTEYNFWVRSNCGSSTFSSWTGPLNVTTLCTPQNVPYTLGFEDTTALGCIAIDDVNGATSWSLFTGGGNGVATGTNSVRYNWDATSPGDDWFFLNGLNLTGNQQYTLTFKYKSSNGPTLLEDMEVKYGTYPDAVSMTSGTIVTLTGIDSAVADAFETSTTNFTPATTGVYYIGFHNYSIPDQAFLYVDDISVDVALSRDDFSTEAIKHYPNPVKDLLNLSYSQDISSAEVYNLMGQKVLSQEINAPQAQINMANLPSGTYIVKVKSSSEQIQTLKISKQ